MKQLNIIFLIIGTIIGAGFLSGKEIVVFFANYGYYSYIFIVPMFFTLYYLFYKLLLLGSKTKINDIDTLNHLIFNKKNKITKWFSFFSFIILSSTMFSAIPTGFNLNTFSIQQVFLLMFIAIIMCIALCYDISIITKLCTFAIPVILVVLSIVCFSNFSTASYVLTSNIILLPYSIITYICRNIFLSYYIIAKSSFGYNQKQCKQISFWSSFILCLFTTIIITVLLSNPELLDCSMPLLTLSASNNLLYIVFFVCLLFAIITTLISSLITLKSFFNFKSNYLNIVVPVIICATLSIIKFDYFVTYLYPLIGVFGFYLVFYLMPFNTLFQNTNKNIHQTSNDTKHNGTSHN